MENHNVFQDRTFELQKALLLDGVSLGIPITFQSDLSYIEHRCSKEGTAFLLITLPTLGKAVDKGLISGTFTCPTGIRMKKNTRLPVFLHTVFCTLFDADGRLRDTADHVTIQWVRQFLLVSSKAQVSFSKETLEKAEQKFCDSQTRLRSKTVRITPLLEKCKDIIQSIFEREELDTFNLDPKHGPGSVAEHREFDWKYDFDTWPKKAERLFPYLQYGTINIIYAIRARPVSLMRKCITRAVFVPKDFRGPRLISVEPAAMQFLQQGMMHRLSSIISKHLRSCVRLDDQTFNRSMAGRAFRDGFSTVDLSSASDNLSAVLCWYLFSGVPNWRRALFSLRSDFVGFPTREVRLIAMSPMGSAICFPVQTIVFTVMALAVTMDTLRCSYIEAKRLVRVFGDDIILPEGVTTDRLLSALQDVGCEVNYEKTCTRTPFRESCGGEWFRDIDVSVIRNRFYHGPCDRSIKWHPVLLDLQRKFFLAGYRNTASLLISWAKEIYPVIVTSTFSNEDVLFAYGDIEDTSRAIYRFNKHLHQFEVKTPCAISKRKRWQSGDELGLTAALISHSYSDRFSTRDSNVKVEWRIIQAFAGVNQLRLA